ncbi:MAG TPA: response regulator, partial [Terriglobales bacterium]
MGSARKPQAGATLSYSQPRLGHSPPRAIGGLAHRGPAKMAPPLAAINIVAANSHVGVVILSMHQDESYVLGALKAGAKGYLLKDSMRGELVQAIRMVSQGRSFLTRK